MSDQILVKFKKGSVADIPSEINEGTLYVTTDEKGLYLDVTNTERIRINEPMQSDLSQTDATAADYVNGVIRQDSLPEGYPYKESVVKRTVLKQHTISSGIATDVWMAMGSAYDGDAVVVFDGVEYPFTISNYAIDFGDPNFVEYPFYFSGYFMGGAVGIEYTVTCGEGTHEFLFCKDYKSETIHTMAPEFLPYEYAQVSYVDEQLSTQLATKQNTLTITDDGNGNVVIS